MFTDAYNLTQGIGCNLESGATNIVQAATALGPLVASAGEFTAYHVPTNGSPLRDRAHPDVSAIGCVATDQRQVVRPVDGDGDGDGLTRCDIGAIEAATVADALFGDSFE